MRVFFATLVVAFCLEVAQQMKSNTRVTERSTAIVASQSMTASVTSKDGTTIGYRQLGHGPGLVILHGTGETHVWYRKAVERTHPRDRVGGGGRRSGSRRYEIQDG
jgi:hypothetical protein